MPKEETVMTYEPKDGIGFIVLNGDAPRLYALMEDIKILPKDCDASGFSTLQEYWEAKPAVDNAAGVQIDNGREPYLFNLEAWRMNLQPFTPVYDLMIAKRGALVGIDLGKGPMYFVPKTLVVWRD